MAGMILTNNGQELITQALLGRTLSFTKVKIGEGILSGQNEKELTELISPYKEIDLTSIEKKGDGIARVRVAFSNEGFPRVVNFREVGVFAKIDDEVEVLYSYENYGDAVESIPADDGLNIVEKIIDTMNYVDDADNVTAIIDKSAVYATMVDLEETQSALGTGISELNNKLETLEKQKLNESNVILTPDGDIQYLVKTDLNTVNVKTGLYFAVNCPNRPFGENGYLFIERSPDNNYMKQTYTRHLSGETWIRVKNMGTLGAWKKVVISEWKPLPLAPGFVTHTGVNQAMYCDCGDFYMLRGRITGNIENNVRIFNLNHGYLSGLSLEISPTNIESRRTFIRDGYIKSLGTRTSWVMFSGIVGKP